VPADAAAPETKPRPRRGRPPKTRPAAEVGFRCPACDSLLEPKAGGAGWRVRENIHAKKLAAIEARIKREAKRTGEHAPPNPHAPAADPAAGRCEKHGHRAGCDCIGCWYDGCFDSPAAR
jgi:hypothetical protein